MMEDLTTPITTPTPTPPYSPDVHDEVATLKGELDRLDAEIREANEERAQAAEYGLVVLEEKQALQVQYEELSALYESTKRELETSVNVSTGARGLLYPSSARP